MSDTDNKEVPLPDLEGGGAMQPAVESAALAADDGPVDRGAADLEAVFDVPVQVSAVLGRASMEVGEAIDIYVNNRLVARGEVVLVEEKLGVTMTEIIKAERN